MCLKHASSRNFSLAFERHGVLSSVMPLQDWEGCSVVESGTASTSEYCRACMQK